MARWDDDLAAVGPRRPFDELIREIAAARGEPTLRVLPPRPTRTPRPPRNKWA